MSQQAEAVAECPSCSAVVPLDATECPRCGELFAEEAIDVEPATEVQETAKEKTAGFREKFLFYTGIVLILIGGPGVALGSWLHDVFHISIWNYNAFDAFGSVNRLVSALGLIILIVGIVFLILSLRLSRTVEPDYDIGTPRQT